MNDEYKSLIGDKYETIVQPVKFSEINRSLKTVNDLVTRISDGNFPAAITRDNLINAQLISISTLHFKGTWVNPFIRSETRLHEFYDAYGNHIGFVDMMYQKGPVALVTVRELNMDVLQLEYAQPSGENCLTIFLFEFYNLRVEGKYLIFSITTFLSVLSPGVKNEAGLDIYIMLPEKGQTFVETAAKMFTYKLESLYLDFYYAKINNTEDVEVFLPKFEINSNVDMKPLMQKVRCVVIRTDKNQHLLQYSI